MVKVQNLKMKTHFSFGVGTAAIPLYGSYCLSFWGISRAISDFMIKLC